LPKLRAVIEELMRKPEKAQEIEERLLREEPGLLGELVEWMQKRQK